MRIRCWETLHKHTKTQAFKRKATINFNKIFFRRDVETITQEDYKPKSF